MRPIHSDHNISDHIILPRAQLMDLVNFSSPQFNAFHVKIPLVSLVMHKDTWLYNFDRK